jgi:hypothetical protein
MCKTRRKGGNRGETCVSVCMGVYVYACINTYVFFHILFESACPYSTVTCARSDVRL